MTRLRQRMVGVIGRWRKPLDLLAGSIAVTLAVRWVQPFGWKFFVAIPVVILVTLAMIVAYNMALKIIGAPPSDQAGASESDGAEAEPPLHARDFHEYREYIDRLWVANHTKVVRELVVLRAIGEPGVWLARIRTGDQAQRWADYLQARGRWIDQWQRSEQRQRQVEQTWWGGVGVRVWLHPRTRRLTIEGRKQRTELLDLYLKTAELHRKLIHEVGCTAGPFLEGLTALANAGAAAAEADTDVADALDQIRKAWRRTRAFNSESDPESARKSPRSTGRRLSAGRPRDPVR